MSATSADRDLEARIEAMRRELAGLVVTLHNAGQRLDDLTDELRSRRQADRVVTLVWPRRGRSGHDPDILVDFQE